MFRRWVRPGEGRLTLSLALLHFLVIAAFTLARIARDGLFLAELPATALPYVYIGLAALSALTVVVFERFADRGESHRGLALALLGTAVSLVLFSFWFAGAPRTAAIAFYLWTGAYGLVLVSQFWILANERANARQARRLFGLVGAAGILGGMAGGGVATLVGGRVPTEWLLIGVALVHCAGALIATRSGLRESERAPEGARGSRQDASAARLLASRYLRWLIALFLVGGITSGVLDYQFKLLLQQRFPEPGRITELLGFFYGTQNVVALLAQLGLAGFIFGRFGARPTAMLLPGGLTIGAIFSALSPAAAAVIATRLFDATLRVSLARMAWEFLYFPLSDEVRRRAKRFIDVVVSRSADAGAGLVILLVNALWGGSLMQLSICVAVFGAGWLLLELMVSRAYTREVSRSLERMVEIDERPALTRDEISSPESIHDLLEDADERRVLHALGVLESLDPGAVKSRASSLLAHESLAVRTRTLALLVSQGVSIDGLDWSGAGPAASASAEAMAAVEIRETAADRVAVAAAAGRSYGSSIPRRRLPELFEDESDDVRRTAFQSAAMSGDRRYLPALLTRLASSVDRRPVREALISYGNGITGTLGDALGDPRVELNVKAEITKVLAGIGTQDAAYSLFRSGHLGTDRLVINMILKALNSIRLARPDVYLPADIVRERMESEILRYCRRVVQKRAMRSLDDDDARSLIERVLSERAQQSLERIFRRLALVYPTRDTLLALRGFRSDNARLRAQSLEYLESILEPSHRAMLIPVLAADSEDERVAKAGLVLDSGSPFIFGILKEMMSSRERWLRACSLYVTGRMRLSILGDDVEAAVHTQDPLIRETAQWARARLAQA